MGYSSEKTQSAQDAAFYSFWGSDPAVSIAACFVLVTLGQVALSFLIGTLFFAPSVRRRNATLLNLLVVTVFVSVPPSLLYYTGYVMDKSPPTGLCAIQAVLMVGTDAMFVVAALALVLEVLFETGLVVLRISERIRVRALVALPYVVFIVFALWGGILAQDTEYVKHELNEVYCSITYDEFGNGLHTVCAAVVILTFALELYAFVFYRRLWRVLSSSRRYVKPPVFNLVSSLRIIAFTSMQMFYFVLLVIGLYMNKVAMYVVPTAYMSLMPLATFFIFGLSYDCLATWRSWLLFWMPPPVPPKPSFPPKSSFPPSPPSLPSYPSTYPYKGVDPLYLEIYVRTKPLPPPPAYTPSAPARSIAPAVNDAKARGEEFPVLDIC